MVRAQKLWIMGGGLVLLVGFTVAMASRGEKGAGVQVATVAREDLQAKVSANGKVQAVAKVDISANVMGQVTKVAVKEGDTVQKGQFLLQIDPSRSKASSDSLQAIAEATARDMESAQARLAQAKSDFARAEANARAGIISQAEYEQARTALATADAAAQASRRRAEGSRADLRRATVDLNYATINAPMDGVVTARRIEPGETAIIGVQNQAGTVLLTISDMSRVEAEMEVDEASIPNVKVAQEARVRIDAYPNQVFDGVVTEVGGSPLLKASQNEATKFKVKVQIRNPPLTIKPGLSAQADIFTGRKDQALAVPFQAIVMREIKRKPGEAAKAGAPKEEEGLFVMDGGKARFVAVKTGLLGELSVEVTSGLQGGEKLVTGPNRVLRELKDGDPVREEKKPRKDPPKG